ncbi:MULTISPECIES: hypothetical protein [unclassified Streptomyces]|jgi:hypothetical protein|uniref:hypothetical protein n=1 Tax=unclassified Streptomyces TaxID=2593676 RepID=UPI0011E67D9E|nr:hypothetical protein [Streptomyces sp. sk2.1]
MPYEYYLESTRGKFSTEAEQRMRRTLERNPATCRFDASTYIVFQSRQALEEQAQEILNTPERNYYHLGQVTFFEGQVIISAAGITEVDHHLYEFTTWALQEFESKLYDTGREASPEEILPRND